jgi:hypothetical protein
MVVGADDEGAINVSHAALDTFMSCCNVSFEEAGQLLFDAVAKIADDRLPPRELEERLRTLPEALRGRPLEVVLLSVVH